MKKKFIPRMHINTTISVELKEKADSYGIKFSEALRVGIATLLAQEGDDNYINSVTVFRNLEAMQTRLKAAYEQIDLLKSKKN